MQGARMISLAAAQRDVAHALEGLSRTDQVTVLLGVLGEIGRRSGDPALFMALVQEAVRERTQAPAAFW